MKKVWYPGCDVLEPRMPEKKCGTIEQLKRDLPKAPEGVEVDIEFMTNRANYVCIFVCSMHNICKIPVHIGYYLCGDYRQWVMEQYYTALEECNHGR